MKLRRLAVGLSAALIAVLSACLPAQQPSPERASFYLLLRGDTIFDERSARTPTELTGEFRDRLRGARVAYTAALADDGLVTRIDMRTYRAGGDTAGDEASFIIRGDSLVAQIGTGAPAHVPSVTGALAIVNPAVAFMEQMVLRARALGQDSVALVVFVLGAPQPIAAVVRRVGPDSVRLDYASVSVHLAVSQDGRVLGGVVPAQGITIARGPAGPPLTVSRPDYGAPRDAPYTAEDVVVTTPAGLHLTGTLTLPRRRSSERAPAIVTITGSGPEDRDEQSGAIPTRPEIDPSLIALVGHSEGGIIAPMVAASDTALRGVVLMAAPASTGREIVAAQNRYVIDSIQHLTGARRVRAPVLILQGETDRQVPPSEADELAAAFRAGGNRDVTVRYFPATNHLFLEDASGAPVDAPGRIRYASLPSLHVRREVLGAIADWLTARFR